MIPQFLGISRNISLFLKWAILAILLLFSAKMRIPRKRPPEAFTEASSSVALHTYANCGIGLSVDAFFASCITCVTLRTTLQQKFPKSVKHYDKNQDLPEEFQIVEVQLLGGEQLNMIMLIFLFISAAFAQDYCGISPSHTLCQYSVSY